MQLRENNEANCLPNTFLSYLPVRESLKKEKKNLQMIPSCRFRTSVALTDLLMKDPNRIPGFQI